MISRKTGIALAIVVATGQAFGAPVAPAGHSLGLSAGQLGVLDGALDLTAADRERIAGAASLGLDIRGRERAGWAERSGHLLVAVKPAEAMGEQIALESAVRHAEGPLRAAPERARRMPALIADRLEHARARLVPSLAKAFEEVDEYRVRIPEGMTEEQLGEALMATGDYAWVDADWTVFPLDTTPNDPSFGQQYHHGSGHLNTVGAWDFITGSPSTLLGVCDTGILSTHVDLASSFVDAFNAVDNLTLGEGGAISDINGHGTGATGCAAAVGNNSTGVAGCAWNAGILHARISNLSSGNANISDIKRGVRWAADNGATTVSVSYSGVDQPSAQNAGDQAEDRGAQLFYSSGNDGIQLGEDVADNIMVIGALGTNGQYTGFSNYGQLIDVMAHGVSVRSTSRSGGYLWFGGTSAAAPLVNGVAALVVEANPDITPAILRAILKQTATDIGASGFDIFTGHGRVNAEAAVVAAMTGDYALPVPFLEQFEGTQLSGAVWIDVVGATVNGDGINEPNGVNSLNLNGGDTASTVRLDAGSASTDTGVSMKVQHQGVEAGEALRVEYFDGGAWQLLFDVVSDGTDRDEFAWAGAKVPAGALTDQLRVRITGMGDEANDRWFVDEFRVKDPVAVQTPYRRTFETPIETTAAWSSFPGVRTTDGASTGSYSARLTGSDVALTGTIAAAALNTGDAYIAIEARDEGADAGESLLIEAKDAGGVWQTVGEIVSDGTPDAGFTLVEAEMTVSLIHGALEVRISAQGDEPSDSWLIDNVYVGPLAGTTACSPADFDGNGALNVDDIDAFVVAFLGGDLAADLDSSGALNVDDIDAFVAAFLAGCA
ncbi:MAG: hypothetical protein DHS20C14_14340 [Phycisphaeraceae bacterium]|nr:MAG: hypothetical protein DHS20C14_14340 [Phycisphaeraceae bacterium]